MCELLWGKKTNQSSIQNAHNKRVIEEDGWYCFRNAVAMMLIIFCLHPSISFAANPAKISAVKSDNITFNIPQQRADTALTQFAEQASLTLVFPFESVKEKTANRLVGDYPIAQAAQLLLENTGLTPTFSNQLVLNIEIEAKGKRNMKTQINQRKSLLATFVAVFASGAVTVSADGQAAGEQNVLEEVIVTAQKREQRIQDVPIAISAITGADLEKLGVGNIEGLYGRVPGLFFGGDSGGEKPRLGSFVSPTIRGVRKRGNDPAVGMYIDDVFQPDVGFDMAFLDLERVEVLRGPQGTLFGRNTLAGAIRLVTKKPNDDARAKFLLEASEFNTFKGQASVSGPLIEGVLAAGLTLQAETTDGYINNITRNSDQVDGRSSSARWVVNFTPSESFDIHFSTDFSEGDKGTLIGVNEGCKCYFVDDDLDSRIDTENYGAGLTINWRLPLFDITSVTGHRHVKSFSNYDTDGAGLLIGNEQSYFRSESFLSEELRLTSNGEGALKWLVGGFVFSNKQKEDRQWNIRDATSTPESAANFAVFEGTHLNSRADYDWSGYALFGQATYSMLDDRLDLTIGGRYSHDSVDHFRDLFVFIPLIPLTDAFDATASQSFSDFTPMASASYRWNDSLMTYATVSEGFKAGGFQYDSGNVTQASTPFDSEQVTNYELGLKGDLADGRMSYALSFYFMDLTDLQVSVLRPFDLGGETGFMSVVDNAASARSKGFELETTLRPTDNLTLNVSLSYTDSEFEEFIDAAGLDRSGEQFQDIPEWLGATHIEYVHHWKNDIDVIWLASYQYIDNVILGTGSSSNPRRTRDSYDLVDASISFSKQAWKLTVFAENVLDDYNVGYSTFPAFNKSLFEEPLPPRQLGIRVTYDM